MSQATQNSQQPKSSCSKFQGLKHKLVLESNQDGSNYFNLESIPTLHIIAKITTMEHMQTNCYWWTNNGCYQGCKQCSTLFYFEIEEFFSFLQKKFYKFKDIFFHQNYHMFIFFGSLQIFRIAYFDIYRNFSLSQNFLSFLKTSLFRLIFQIEIFLSEKKRNNLIKQGE